MEYALVVMAVVAIWGVTEKAIELDNPTSVTALLGWSGFTLVLSLGGACIVDYARWWYGFGLWGFSIFVMRLGDLLLAVTERARFAPLDKGARPPR